MNERIEELARDCWSTSEYDTSLDPWFNHRKFAKLIVAECIQAVDNVGGYNEEFHMNAIKEHFGVEE